MCAWPSSIPINTSFISLGINICFLSDEDKGLTPFVEPLLIVTKLAHISYKSYALFLNNGRTISSLLYKQCLTHSLWGSY